MVVSSRQTVGDDTVCKVTTIEKRRRFFAVDSWCDYLECYSVVYIYID